MKLLTHIYYFFYIRAFLLFKPADFFDRLYALPWYQNMLEEWVSQNVQPSSEVDSLKGLEIGCAGGSLCHFMHRQGMDIIGIDNSPKMIESANRKFPNLNFQLGDAKQLSFDDKTFDWVSSASVINIINEPEKMLSEMLRVCKPRCKISLLFPVEGFNNQTLKTLIKQQALSGFSESALRTWHRMARKMPLQTFETLLLSFDLKIDSIQHFLNGMVIGITISQKSFS